MKTLGRIFFGLSFSVVMICCEKRPKVVTMGSFPIEKTIPCDSSGIIEGIDHYVRIGVTNDFLFLQGNRAEKVFQQYALPRVEYIKSFGFRGRGPDEYPMTPDMFISPSTGKLYVHRYETGGLLSYTVSDSGDILLKEKFNKIPDRLYNQFHIIGDSLLIYNKMPDMGIGKMNILTGEDKGEISFRSDYFGDGFYHPDWGIVAANGNHIVYVYHFRKQIDIYNTDDLTLKIRLLGEGGEGNAVIDKYSKKYYYNVYCTDKYIYAYYADPNASSDNAIEVYDYDGTPVAKYSIEIQTGGMFAVTPDDNTLYGYNYMHEDKILKYVLR